MRVIILFKCLGSNTRLRHSVYSHLTMFENREDYSCLYWNVANGCPGWLKKIECDVIVLHTTLLSARYGLQTAYDDWIKGLSWVRESRSLKIALPQDERYYSKQLCSWLQAFKIDIVFSVLMHKPQAFDKVYKSYSGSARFFPCLTGYIDKKSLLNPEFNQWKNRRIDIAYRAKTLPLWIGRIGQLKRQINESLRECLSKSDLVYDISADVKDTKLGSDWLNFLHDSKLIAGCEAGGSGFDESGAITEFVNAQKSKGNIPTFEDIDSKFGSQWDGHDFFVLGPRHLEAAATGTCQILVEGDYSGVLKRNRHYIPVKKDLSDLCDVIKSLNWDKAQEIAQFAYDDLVVSDKYTYSMFANKIHSIVIEQSSSIARTYNEKQIKKFNLLRIITHYINRAGFLTQAPYLCKLWIKNKFLSV